MESFLELVAEDLLRQTNKDLSHVAVIFPNKRASIFLNEYIAQKADGPTWTPAYFTISELFSAFSKYRAVDPIKAVCRLYKVYCDNMIDNKESMDKFYGWGEVLLKDFDDVDKSIADVNSLFCNISDIRALEDTHYLTEEQENAIKTFFKDFSADKNTLLKQRFLNLWNKMSCIYNQYKDELKSDGELYQGAIERDVIESTDDEKWNALLTYDEYVFVGFNFLSKTQDMLFSKIQQMGKAVFYWDYDIYYTFKNSHFEAGKFIRENMIKYPNSLSEEHYNNLLNNKKIEIVSATTDNSQVRYIPEWLIENCTPFERDTAVVLCDETLLEPTLHCIPNGVTCSDGNKHIQNVNLTMGFPLSDTPIASFLDLLMELQTNGYNMQNGKFHETEVYSLKKHPYYQSVFKGNNEQKIFIHGKGNIWFTEYITEIIADIATYYRQNDTNSSLAARRQNVEKKVRDNDIEEDNNDIYHQLYQEALFRAHTIITRFHSLISEGILTIEANTLKKLIREVFSTTKIPFHGEPAIGLQIMGLLETRNIDFKHVLLLSANEGMMPQTSSQTSFIPYMLRLHFGLSVPDHEVALYAYTFFRLIQRADHITLLYNNATQSGKINEVSRFIRQIEKEIIGEKDTSLELNHISLLPALKVESHKPITVEKSDEIIEKLHRNFNSEYTESRALSPSAINTYISCPLKFYFMQVASLRPEKEVEDEIDAPTFGLIFHQCAHDIYSTLIKANSIINKEDIEHFIKEKSLALNQIIDRAFYENYFSKIDAFGLTEQPDELPFNGMTALIKDVIHKYLIQLLNYDMQLTPFEIIALEESNIRLLRITTNSENVKIKIGGTIDRIDKVNYKNDDIEDQQVVRIVDYKTSNKAQVKLQMEKLFDKKNEQSYIIQTFIYASTIEAAMNKDIDSLPLPQQESHTQQILSTPIPIAPALFYIGKSASDKYSPYVITNDKKEIWNFGELSSPFLNGLKKVIEEIFSPEVPFKQTEYQDKCTFCDYKFICGKD